MSEDFDPRTAVEWRIALSETPDDAVLKQRFEIWLAADEAHRQEWRTLSEGLDNFLRLGPLHREKWARPVAPAAAGRPPPATLRTLGRRVAAAGRPVRPRRSGRLAIAACAAAVAGAVVWSSDLPLRLRADYVTGTAETRAVALDDGSLLELAPRSAVTISYSSRLRDIRLLQGEALFTVRHDGARPFRVRTGKLTVTDIGTVFDVRLSTEGDEIAVREGQVRVEDATGGTRTLGAGAWEKVTPLARGVSVTLGTLPPEDVGGWSGGQIIAKRSSVANVVGRLKPYYHGVVVYGPELGQKSVTGVYDATDPVGAFRAIAEAQHAQLHRITPWLVILSPSAMASDAAP